MSTTTILAPLSGAIVPLPEVPDPVFAQGIMGPGAAVAPPTEVVDVVAPASGTLLKVLPHAFVILTDEGYGVLVHLGIDTVSLNGEGFTVLVTQGDRIAAGDPVVIYDVPAIAEHGLATISPVILIEFSGTCELASGLAGGAAVPAGAALLTASR